MHNDIAIVGAVRTAIGSFGGTLADVPLTQLAETVIRGSLEQAGIWPGLVSHTVFGNVIPTNPADLYLARVASLNAGVPTDSSAMNVNRICGSGLEAILTAARVLAQDDGHIAVAGGAESMSRVPYWLPSMRWGAKMRDSVATDALMGALTDPINNVSMAQTVEHLASIYDIDRETQDVTAAASHARAVIAQSEGRFKSQIVPVLKPKPNRLACAVDEGPREGDLLPKLRTLRPLHGEGGTITAGNASSLNDGAAAVTLMRLRDAERYDVVPMARLVGSLVCGCDPMLMGAAPAAAIMRLCAQVKIPLDSIDVIEINEAFAAQLVVVEQMLGLESERVNPNGGALALGHPIGATGAILVVKALHELKRINGRYALVSLCIGGGQGIAAIFENLR